MGKPLVALSAAGLAVGLWAFTPMVALGSSVALVTENFEGSTTQSPNWTVPGAPDGENVACLTAGTSTSQTPIPGCDLSTPDASGSGALQLTGDAGGEEGGIAYSLSQPGTYGIDAVFDTYQYGGDAADGIAFFMAAANPSDPAPPADIGQAGGDLGYSADGSNQGMTYGYLGIGFDNWGNYSSSGYQGSGCSDPTLSNYQGSDQHLGQGPYPDAVTLRGPGNGSIGYCILDSTDQASYGGFTGNLDGGPSGTRSSSQVPVEIVINPTGSTVTTASGLSLPNDTFAVAFTPLNGSKQVLTGTLPTTGNGGIPSGLYPSGYIDPTTGIPYQITFGWVGSTGGDYDYHQVNLVTSGTASGTPPELAAEVTDNASHAPAHGSTMDYAVNVSNQSGAGAESDTVTLTDTLPAGETLQSGGASGSGWSCSASGQTVTCTDPGPISSGGSLSALTIPVTVSATSGSVLTNSVTVSSNDASPASGSDTVTVAKLSTSLTAAANLASTTYGNTVSLSASGLPTAATGTVTFAVTGGSTLCGPATVSVGSASCSTAVLNAAGYSVTATYSGDGNYSGSTATTSFTITKASTLFSVSPNPASTTHGNTVTLSASGLPTAATGTVTFAVTGGSTLCGPATVSVGSASCSTAVLNAAGYSVTATYSGDGNYGGSTATTSFTITKASTSFTASASPSTEGYSTSDSVTLSATGLPSGAGGTVTFAITGGSTLCGPASVSGGSASCSTSELGAGSYSMTATYTGDSNYNGSTATTSFTITKASTSLTASASPSSTSYGNTVTLSVSGLPLTATGTVTFAITGGSTLCGPATVSGGAASCSTSVLDAATYPVTATYSGDGNFLGSTATASFTIVPAATSLSATASPSSVASGDTVTLSATGLPAGATGTVTFSSAGSTLCSSTVSSGSASCAGTWAAGTYPVLASYPGNNDFLGSTAATSFAVTANPVLDLTVSGIPPGIAAGGEYTVTLTAGLSPAGGPAYVDPVITFSLSGSQTFVATPSAAGWSCSVTAGGTLLTCVSSAVVPVAAGTFPGSVSVTVDVSELASGGLQDQIGLVDTADGAAPCGEIDEVGLTAASGVGPPDTGASSGMLPWLPVGLALLAMGAAICAWSSRRRWSGKGSRPQR